MSTTKTVEIRMHLCAKKQLNTQKKIEKFAIKKNKLFYEYIVQFEKKYIYSFLY